MKVGAQATGAEDQIPSPRPEQASPRGRCLILVLVHRAAGEPSGLLVHVPVEHDLVQHVDHVDLRKDEPNGRVVFVKLN